MDACKKKLDIWYASITSSNIIYMLLVEKYHYSFIETSALDSSNVGEAFNNLLVGKCIKKGPGNTKYYIFIISYSSSEDVV